MRKTTIVSWLLASVLILILNSHSIAAQSKEALINGDFETGNLNGWVVQGDTTVTADDLDPYTDGSLHSVAHGIYSAKIGDEIPWGQSGPQSSSISQEVQVPSPGAGQTKTVMQFSYSVIADDPPDHAEQDKPLFKVTVEDLTTQEVLYNTSYIYTSQTSGKWFLGRDPNGDPNTGILQRTFSSLVGDRWVYQSWQNVDVDLTSRVGHQVRLEFLVRDCNPGAHAAYGYLDNISVGEPNQRNLPKLEGTPIPAPWIDPTLISMLIGVAEALHVWPWVLCCLPLLLWDCS